MKLYEPRILDDILKWLKVVFFVVSIILVITYSFIDWEDIAERVGGAMD